MTVENPNPNTQIAIDKLGTFSLVSVAGSASESTYATHEA